MRRFASSVVLVVVAGLLGFGLVSVAQAGEARDQGAAYLMAVADAQKVLCSYPAGSSPRATRANPKGTPLSSYFGAYECQPSAGTGYFWYELGVGWTWPTGKTCSARASYQAGIVGSTTSQAKQCDGGCEMVPAVGTMKLRLDTRDTSIFTSHGNFSPSGAGCSNGAEIPPRTPPKDEFCTTLEGGGYQLCPQKDGRVCVKSNASGRKFCGNNDYPTVGVDPARTEAVAISASTNPVTPAPVPVPRVGETFVPDSSASVTNTTTNNTTNITNYNNGGTPNNTPGSETPGDGSDNPGEGEEEEQGGSVSGGAGCDSPPVCSGGDMILCASLVQAWKLRCETGDIVDNPSLDEVNSALGEGMGTGPDFFGHPGGNLGTFTPGAVSDYHEVEDGDSAIEFDSSGFLGGGSCPIAAPVSVNGNVIPFTFQPICNLLISLSNIILGLAYFIGLKIFLGARD